MLAGASAFLCDMVETVESANAAFYAEAGGDAGRTFAALSEELVAALGNERESVRARLGELDRMLSCKKALSRSAL